MHQFNTISLNYSIYFDHRDRFSFDVLALPIVLTFNMKTELISRHFDRFCMPANHGPPNLDLEKKHMKTIYADTLLHAYAKHGDTQRIGA